MTPQEAIRRIKDHNEVHSLKEKHFAVYITEALNMACEALEKQIPKKVKEYKEFEEGTFYRLDFRCPVCGNTVIGQPYKPDYCKHCGQALDWSGTK